MRAFLALLTAVLASIGIGVGVVAAIGVSPTSNEQQFVNSAIKSIGSSPYLQLESTINATALSKSDQTINQLSYGINVSSDDGSTSLSNLKSSKFGVQIFIARNGADLVDVRVIDTKSFYVEANLSAIANLPGIPSKVEQQLKDAAPLLGGRWFRIPASALGTLGDKLGNNQDQPAIGNLSKSTQKRLQQQVEAAARRYGSTSLSTTSNGKEDLHASIEVLPFVRQVFPEILQTIATSTSQLPRAIPKNDFGSLSGSQGKAELDLIADSGTTELDQVNIQFSNAKSNIAMMTTVDHASAAVNVPNGAVTLPKAIINALGKALDARIPKATALS